MEYLQQTVSRIQAEKGEKVQEVVLVLDVRTRWNSMIAMLDSFFKVKSVFGNRAGVFSPH
jgi:hypothetical protein